MQIGGLRALLRRLPGWQTAGRLSELLRGRERRSVALLRLMPPKGLFQPESTTGPDRYPALFAFARSELARVAAPRLLSFGCSTGAEVFTLRRHFPAASIKGIDIGTTNIRVCRERLAGAGGDPQIAFEIAATAAGEPPDSYDAVFALAVFRHGDLGARPPACDAKIRFAEVDAEIAHLTRCLKPGGLFFVRHANFRMADMSVARHYERVLVRPGAPGTPIYGADNRLIEGALGDDGVYLKRA